ncbi:ankyrin repeat domain-containing protein [Aspergillus thermomutatus]|uniref:Uncharacterized protein n=1 Tax=Aspergillus thermomutatus TaxID=41047 RepID=A0A397GJH8_ASPTH|nr:uncharacterized protein CDV56_101333 [Aspergillus thermomutatus]RHZ50339.1 hypothetical protein CDV56_101333 [Aspergillus thermomutatus]
MYLFLCEILLLGFICVRYPDLQVKIPISFSTLLHSFTGPLTAAFEAGQASRVESRSSPKAKDVGYPSPRLFDMATYEIDPEIGLGPDDPGYWGVLHWQLHYACYRNDVARVNYILSLGADINFKNELGYTALEWANQVRHLDVAKCLLQNLNVQLHGYTMTAYHIRAKHTVIVRALLDLGVKGMLARNKDRHRGLIVIACQAGHPTILKMLMNCVPGYMITDYKQVYLQIAAAAHHDELLKVLRKRVGQEEAWIKNYFKPRTPVIPVQLPPRDLEYEKLFDEFINPEAYLP